MATTMKFSISLPAGIACDVESSRRASKETRSDFFRRAAEALLRKERERAAVERYVAGYVAHPETEQERAWAELGATALRDAEW